MNAILTLTDVPGGETVTSLFCWAISIEVVCIPICHTHVPALLSHYFESVACVYSVIFSLPRRCTGGRVPFSDPRCFLPVTMYCTTHAHLVHMCWPLLWGLQIPLQGTTPGVRPSRGDRLPPPEGGGGDRRALQGEISRGGQGGGGIIIIMKSLNTITQFVGAW